MSILSQGNTTLVPPTNGTFVGVIEENSAEAALIMLVSDQPGTLYMECAVSRNHFDTAIPITSLAREYTPGSAAAFIFEKGYRPFRVRFIRDGEEDFTYFGIKTTYGPHNKLTSGLGTVIPQNFDALVVRSVPTDLDLAFGLLLGISEGVKFGYAQDLPTSIVLGTPSSWVTLWSYGGLRTHQTSSFTPFFASNDAADTSIQILVFYLDADGLEQTKIVTTDASDGTNPVSFGEICTDVYSAEAQQDLIGDVTFATTNNFTSGDADNLNEVLAHIPPEDNRTQQLAAKTPSNKRRRIKYLRVAMLRDNGGDGAVIGAFQTREAGKAWVTKEPILITHAVPYENTSVTGIILPPSTDYRVIIRDVSDPSTFVKGRLAFDDLTT